MVKAKFKTAYLQRETVMDVKVAANMKVGTVVTLSSETITAVEDDVTTPALTHYIVAQSDMTMDRRDYTKHDYEYSDVVKQSATAKKVALFKVIDIDDVVYTVVS